MDIEAEYFKATLNDLEILSAENPEGDTTILQTLQSMLITGNPALVSIFFNGTLVGVVGVLAVQIKGMSFMTPAIYLHPAFHNDLIDFCEVTVQGFAESIGFAFGIVVESSEGGKLVFFPDAAESNDNFYLPGLEEQLVNLSYEYLMQIEKDSE